MSKHIPYFDFYPADFMHGVRGLSAQEVGVYTMMLCRIYEENGPVEFHVKRLATYCGMREATFKKTVETLIELGKLDLRDGAIFNRRAEVEISSRANKLKINSKAGKASAEKRQQNQQVSPTDVQRTFNHTDTDTDTEATLNSVANAPPRDDLDILRSRLLDAIGDENIQGHGAFDLSIILGMISAGVSLEIDIIPMLKARRPRMKTPARSWSFFEGAIRDAYERRIGAAKAVSPLADDLKAGTLMRQAGKLVPTTESRWRQRVDSWRGGADWFRAEWGPPPGETGCNAPQHLLQNRQEAA